MVIESQSQLPHLLKFVKQFYQEFVSLNKKFYNSQIYHIYFKLTWHMFHIYHLQFPLFIDIALDLV